MKDRVDIVDDEKHLLKYTVIEVGVIGTKLKSYSFEIYLAPTINGGCLSNIFVDYDTIDDRLLPEEEVTKLKEGVMSMVKAVEAYLQANPDAYV